MLSLSLETQFKHYSWSLTSFAFISLIAFLAPQGVVASRAELVVNPETQFVQVVASRPTSVVVQWNAVVQALVVETSIGPTLAANAYGAMHTAMYDAWTAFDSVAHPVFATPEFVPTTPHNTLNKENAVGWAALRTLVALFPTKRDELLSGNFPHPVLRTGGEHFLSKTIGERAADATVPAYEREALSAEDDFLFESSPATNVVDRWFAETVPIDDPAGRVQKFLTPTFGRRKTFGVRDGKDFRPPPPDPFLLRKGGVDVGAATITLTNGTKLNVSDTLIGSVINPKFIRQAKQVIGYSRRLSDKSKLSAEFWEDGSGTSFPPGTWMTFGQYVSARDGLSLDEDVKLFFMLGNAVRDAGICTWNAKAYYFYTRPVRTIRDLAKLNLIGRKSRKVDGRVIRAYSVHERRVGVIRAEEWLTYQTPGSDPSPPFPEYTSGHSAFSASAAQILRRFTRSNYFGGQLVFARGSSRFEPGSTPKTAVKLRWSTFSRAADEAGLSRLHGGIHFVDGDLNGRTLGRKVGAATFTKAMKYIKGKVPK